MSIGVRKLILALACLAVVKLGLLLSLGPLDSLGRLAGLLPGPPAAAALAAEPAKDAAKDSKDAAPAKDPKGAPEAKQPVKAETRTEPKPDSKTDAKPDSKAAPAAPGKEPQAAADDPAAWSALRTREEALNRREQSLASLEKELDARLARLQTLEGQIKKMLEEANGVRDQKLLHLVEVYTNMKSKQAAQVLETLDPDIAVKILAQMKGKQAGEILSSVDAKKAARLSEALTRLQLGPAPAN